MEQNYKSNSHRSKTEKKSTEEKPEVKKVISGNARVKKKSGVVKLAEDFFQDDLKNVGSYVVMDVIIPTIKNTILDVGERLLFGDTGRSRKRGLSNRVSYRDYFDKSNRNRRHRDEDHSPTRYSYDDIILNNRGDAEEVLDSMQDIIDEYDEVTVASLFDLVGISAQYTDQKYGWTSISDANIVRTRDGGYMIDLPRPRALK